MSGPIKPAQVIGIKREQIPNEVFDAFNELIVKNWNGSSSTILQKDVASLIVDRGISQEALFLNHWLDVEDVYRKAGWVVEYDKPAYCETYEASFKFSKRVK